MTSITIKEYFAVPGSPYSNKDAVKIGPELYELSQQGGVTARDVVDAARSSNSPLHDYFEWDDKVAADEFRLDQGRRMLRSIKVRFEDGGEKKEARAFQIQRVGAYEPAQRTYKTFQVLHADSAFAAQMMDSAIDDLAAWKRKYEPYIGIWERFGDAFQQVINQIDEFRDEVQSQSVSEETDRAIAALVEWRAEYSSALSTWTQAREQVGFIMEAIGAAMKVAGSSAKERDCLKCATSFRSVGPENRICKACMKSLPQAAAGMGNGH